MEVQILPRSCVIEVGWRLATVKEAQLCLESIKHLLKTRDKARLLDGWIGGSSYEFHAEVGFRSCVGYMVLIKSPPPDGIVNYRYSEVTLSEEGMRAALFLCTEDWNYEVVCWLLECWSKGVINQVIPWESIESYEVVDACKQVSDLAIELQFVHSWNEVSERIEQASKSRFSDTTIEGPVSSFLKIVTDKVYNPSFREMLSKNKYKKVAEEYCRQVRLAEGTQQAISDAIFLVIDAMAVRIIRDWVIQENVANVTYIVSYANELLERTIFGDNSLGRIVREAADIAKGNLQLFKEILSNQGFGTFSSSGRYSFLNTVLVQAARKGDVNVMQQLIDSGVVEPLETDNAERETALHYAAKFDNQNRGYEMAEMLLRGERREMLANVPDKQQRTPLHNAAFSGHALICSLLIQHNASTSAKDIDGKIPLHYALGRQGQNEEVITELIKEDFSSVELEGDDGDTPLDYAIRFQGNNTSMMTSLLLPLFKKQKDHIKKLDLQASYLRKVSEKGHLDLVKMLLEHGANPFDRNMEGQTALHYAAKGIVDQQALDIIQELVVNEYKQVNDVELATCDKHGRTVLHVAASAGHKKLCEWLLKQDETGADSKDRDGRNAVYYAVGCKNDDAELLDVWLRRRFPRQAINISHLKDFRERTPLHVAAEKGNLKMVETILSQVKPEDRETTVGAADVFGQTALHKAARGGHSHVVRTLLRKGAHPLTERDCDGKTALHYAVRAENGDNAQAIAKLLLESCQSNNEKILLLNAFAVGTGLAEECVGSNSSVTEYLHKENRSILEKTETQNFLRVAATEGNIDMAKELLNRGFNINHIRSKNWRASLSASEKVVVQDVLDHIDHTDNFVELGTDKPALQDNLGRKAFADGLASLFLNPFVISPITVGISGEWGMGKSSVMLQMESALLKTAAQLAVKENFHGLGGSRENNINKWHLKVLRDILDTYRPKYQKVYKSLAIAKRRDKVQDGNKKEEEESRRDNQMQGIIPSILTVSYNAWQYRNQSEAWAGLGVVIIKELESAMTVAQRLRSSWRYNWASRKQSICVEVILPCFLAVTVAIWVTVILWFVLDRAENKKLKDFKYGSLPITLIAVSWATMKSVMSVVKPISSQVVDYLSLPDHSQNLGYHQKVIDDINILKDELGYKPSWWWKVFAFLWCWVTFSSGENYVPGTTIPKMIPASKDNLRMVVFVDDLDRCQENVILKILSAINLVLSVCEINVVMAMDKGMIERAIERVYGDAENKSDKSSRDLADKFLRKIIQLPLDLPDPSHFHSNCFLQAQLGVLAVQNATNDSEDQTVEKFGHAHRKLHPMSRKETLISRHSRPGKESAGGANSHSPDQEQQEDKTRDSGGSTMITIPGAIVDEEPPNEDEQHTDNLMANGHGNKSWVRTWIKQLTSFVLCKQKKSNLTFEQEWTKIFPESVDFEMLKPKYSRAERDALCFFQTQVTGSRKLPREWKRLLNYHRLAWYILSKGTEVKTMEGWQVQLIAWVFICWQWKDQINSLIQGWYELGVFESWTRANDKKSSGPSLRDIVEHYIDERWPSHKTSSLAHGDVKGNVNNRIEETEVPKVTLSAQSKIMSREEDTGREDYVKEVVRKVLKEKKKQERKYLLKIKVLEERRSKQELKDWLKIVRKVLQDEKEFDDSLKVKEKKPMQKQKAYTERGKANNEEEQKEQGNVKETLKPFGVIHANMEEKEEKKWKNLRETLKRYDVSMSGIIIFQNFRFYCVPRYLDW